MQTAKGVTFIGKKILLGSEARWSRRCDEYNEKLSE